MKVSRSFLTKVIQEEVERALNEFDEFESEEDFASPEDKMYDLGLNPSKIRSYRKILQSVKTSLNLAKEKPEHAKYYFQLALKQFNTITPQYRAGSVDELPQKIDYLDAIIS